MGFTNGYFMARNNVGDGLGTVGSHLYASGAGAGSTVNVNDGMWHQLVGVFQAGVGTSYYVDGVLEGSGGAGGIGANDAPFMVGGVDSFGTVGGYFTGLISDVQVYDNALSASDVSSIYDAVIDSRSVPEPSSLVLIGLGMAWRLEKLRTGETKAVAFTVNGQDSPAVLRVDCLL